jgi:hypothetical protein
LLLIRDAAVTDPEMAALKAELDEQRIQRMTHNARNLSRAGHLRADVTVQIAAEVGWVYTSPELYEPLIKNRGWPLERFGAFIADALIAHLLRPEAPDGAKFGARGRRRARRARRSQ